MIALKQTCRKEQVLQPCKTLLGQWCVAPHTWQQRGISQWERPPTVPSETVEKVLKYVMNIGKEQAPLLPGRVPGFKRTDVRLLPCIFRWGFIFSLVCLLIVSLNKKENPNLRKQCMTLASTFTFLKFKVMMASHQSSGPLLMVRLPLRVWNKWHFNKNL